MIVKYSEKSVAEESFKNFIELRESWGEDSVKTNTLYTFEITDFWWKANDKIPLNEINQFEYIFFFHVMFPHQIMKKFIGKKIMWAPMYDALNFRNSFFKSIFWKQITNLGIKVLKFSDKIAESIGKEEVD